MTSLRETYQCWCGGDHTPWNHKCQFCDRNHCKDKCIICEKVGHSPVKCPSKCYCVETIEQKTGKWHFTCVDMQTVHKATNHSCKLCAGKHTEDKCPMRKCDCGRNHTVPEHESQVCKICTTIHYKEPCVICKVSGHAPMDCDKRCPCVKIVTIQGSYSDIGGNKWHRADDTICVKSENCHTRSEHVCKLCSGNHIELELSCAKTRLDVIRRFAFLKKDRDWFDVSIDFDSDKNEVLISADHYDEWHDGTPSITYLMEDTIWDTFLLEQLPIGTKIVLVGWLAHDDNPSEVWCLERMKSVCCDRFVDRCQH